MRITGGSARGRKIIGPGRGHSAALRPTGDRVREALFNLLGGLIHEARVLELFCGTGSVGLEALSRGADTVVFVDKSRFALQLLQRNLAAIFPGCQTAIIRLDLGRKPTYASLAGHPLCRPPFDLVFLDPPYEKKLAELALTMVDKNGLVRPGGTVVAEERWKADLPPAAGRLTLQERRRYGETALWLYKAGQD